MAANPEDGTMPPDPGGEINVWAGVLFDEFRALVRAGFSDQQALQLLGTAIAVRVQGG